VEWRLKHRIAHSNLRIQCRKRIDDDEHPTRGATGDGGVPPTNSVTNSANKDRPVINDDGVFDLAAWNALSLHDRLQLALLTETPTEPIVALYRGFAFLPFGEELLGQGAAAFRLVADLTRDRSEPEMRKLHERALRLCSDVHQHALDGHYSLLAREFDPENEIEWPAPTPVTHRPNQAK